MIQIDTREQNNKHIIKYFENMGVEYFCEKLDFGDYTNPLNEKKVVIDRKKDLVEWAGNLGKGHQRFKAELERAKDCGYKVIVLIEQKLNYDDLKTWQNPMAVNKMRVLRDGTQVARPAMTGLQMWKICEKWKQKYDLNIWFCEKETSGSIIATCLRDE